MDKNKEPQKWVYQVHSIQLFLIGKRERHHQETTLETIVEIPKLVNFIVSARVRVGGRVIGALELKRKNNDGLKKKKWVD